jgi:Alpha/beta hydrolase domain
MTVAITGPIVGGTHGWLYAAAIVELAAEGYVEEEYFFEGNAPTYRPIGELGVNGRWAIEKTGSTPFKTRAVVRRPIDPTRFNGTVIVEWNNVSAGSEIFEAGDTPVIFDEGFAYVGVSAQRVGVHGFDAYPQGLRTWDPERYGSLHIQDDSLSYGIFTEVARAFAPVRRGQPRTQANTQPSAEPDPLEGLDVRKLLAFGGSQSASRLVTYINAIHPIEKLFDGFVAFTWFGSGSSIDHPSHIDFNAGGLAGLDRYPTQIRDDLNVPVMVVNSECETLSCVGVRQSDTERFRFWEVAGAAHGPALHMQRILPKMQRDGAQLPGTFDPTTLGPVPWAPVLDAAIAQTQAWINGGPPPPSQVFIDVENDATTSAEAGVAAPRIKRDQDGNAIGGVRVPEQEVTLSANIGAMEDSGGAGLMGTWSALAAHVIHERYPSEVVYLDKFKAAYSAAVAAGVLRPSDEGHALETARLRFQTVLSRLNTVA